jgi:tetratricopeptide (TPR) repeat protein
MKGDVYETREMGTVTREDKDSRRSAPAPRAGGWWNLGPDRSRGTRWRFAGWVALLVFFLGCSGQALAEKLPDDRPLAPDQLAKLMEASKVSYRIGKPPEGVTPDEIVEKLWPLGKAQSYPWVEKQGDGGSRLVAYPFTEADVETLAQVEPLFEKSKFEEAKKRYEAIAASSPKNYLAISSIGDCHYLRGEYEAAAPHFERALALNPYHHVNYLKLGNALVRLGRRDEALDTFLRGLVARPRQKSILGQLAHFSASLGVRIEESQFQPRAYAEPSAEGIDVYLQPEADWYWLTYAMCKAVWLGEGDYRAARLKRNESKTAHEQTDIEELDCLKSLIVGYRVASTDGTASPDPLLDRRSRILDAGMLEEFVIYELFSRVAPDVTLLLPQGADGVDLRKFIETFVVVKER